MSDPKHPAKEATYKYQGERPVVMFGNWRQDVRILTDPADLAEWERRMEAHTGAKWTAKAVIDGGGSCCGGDSDGQCDLI
jgi:hypothetical protein